MGTRHTQLRAQVQGTHSSGHRYKAHTSGHRYKAHSSGHRYKAHTVQGTGTRHTQLRAQVLGTHSSGHRYKAHTAQGTGTRHTQLRAQVQGTHMLYNHCTTLICMPASISCVRCYMLRSLLRSDNTCVQWLVMSCEEQNYVIMYPTYDYMYHMVVGELVW